MPRITLKVAPQAARLVVRRSPSTSLAILYPRVEWSSFWLYSTSIHKAISRRALPRVGYTIEQALSLLGVALNYSARAPAQAQPGPARRKAGAVALQAVRELFGAALTAPVWM